MESANNFAVQFFRGNGQFYCEIRKGGVAGTTRSAAKYLPYEPPKIEPTDAGTAQLAKLLDLLSPENDPQGDYLQAFFDMINNSILDMPFPPSSYSAYANSIIGKPLCLVNAGWSIELAEEPLRQQYSLRAPASDPQKVMSSYQFPLKIGDKTRTFDGVVGYFMADNPSKTSTEQLTSFKKTYTYFNSGASKQVQDATPNDIKLTPYYTHPDDAITPDMLFDRERHYTVTSILMDPYVSIHGYSPILPTKTLTLSPWTVEEAMKNMHAFFRLGPSLLREDVPKTVDAALAIGTALKKDPTARVFNLSLPISGSKGTWTWLQPYALPTPPPPPPPPAPPKAGAPAGQPAGKPPGAPVPAPKPVTPKDAGKEEEKDTKYVEIPVIEDGGGMKFDNGPFTFVEGYLQLMGSLAGR
jgi:hypothetical protein